MPEQRSEDEPERQTIPTSKAEFGWTKMATKQIPFGLSAAEFSFVMQEMIAVVRLVGRHGQVSVNDALQEAFVMALSKPITDRPSTKDQKKFVAWMCNLAKYAALTNRQTNRRRARREDALDVNSVEQLSVPPSIGAVEARKMLHRAMLSLEPAEQALLVAVYNEGKTIEDLAREQGLPWATVKYRLKRVLNILYSSLQILGVLGLLWVKKIRDAVAAWFQKTHLTHGAIMQISAPIAVTMVCAVSIPSNFAAMTESFRLVGLAQTDSSQRSLPPGDPPNLIPAAGAQLGPTVAAEVAPEEPKGLDIPCRKCSLVEMNSTKITNILQGTVLPFAFLVTPVLSQMACVGAEQQTHMSKTPAEEDEPEENHHDVNYRAMCLQERARGNKCISREEWDKIVQ